MDLFTRNSPYYHLLKYLLFLLKHPVYEEKWTFCEFLESRIRLWSNGFRIVDHINFLCKNRSSPQQSCWKFSSYGMWRRIFEVLCFPTFRNIMTLYIFNCKLSWSDRADSLPFDMKAITVLRNEGSRTPKDTGFTSQNTWIETDFTTFFFIKYGIIHLTLLVITRTKIVRFLPRTPRPNHKASVSLFHFTPGRCRILHVTCGYFLYIKALLTQSNTFSITVSRNQ
jgi:hypothetical protein